VDSKQRSNPDSLGFEAIDPWKSKHLAVRRRNLPHLEVPGATYFVTFRCRSISELPAQARHLVLAAILECDQKSIDLDAAVIMPGHVHLIFRLVEPYELSPVLQRIKGGSARQINQMLGREGSVWSDESFDHVIRDGAELEEKLEYIRQNPVKRALVKHPDRYQWLYTKSITG
jgi:REP element-mobilizing transposase RayT